MPLFQCVEENLRAAMRCYSFASEQGETRDLSGVTIASCGMDYPVFNSAMLTSRVDGGVAEMDQRIAMAQVHYKARQLGWSFWVCEDLLHSDLRGKAPNIFQNRKMEPIAHPPGMLAERLAEPARGLPQLDCRRITNARTRFDFADIASTVFSLPFVTSKKIYGNESTWNSGMSGYVGYVESKPVSIVTIVLGGGVIGIYSLGTLPQHQRSGFGESLMRHAVEEARRESGMEAMVLQSTKQGLGLYERMGFRLVTKFAVYMAEGCD